MLDKKKMSKILSPILQKGVIVKTLTGITVRVLLEDELQVSHDVVDNQIATVFLDGRPVDDIDRAIVTENSEIALSGAMPGFVGAAMRRGGYYSRMRSEITHTAGNILIEKTDGLVKIRLYNTLIDLIGPILLNRGFLVPSDILPHLLSSEHGSKLKTQVDPNSQNLVLISGCQDQ